MFKIKSAYINPTGQYSMASIASNLYRVYKNPNARDLFIKAQKADTVKEREKLFNEMGEYKIVVEKEKRQSNNRLMQFLKGFFYAD